MISAKVYVTLKTGVLDPEGQAVARSLSRLGFSDVKDARIGKFIELKLEGDDLETAAHEVERMCDRLLANTVIEDYRYELAPA